MTRKNHTYKRIFLSMTMVALLMSCITAVECERSGDNDVSDTDAIVREVVQIGMKDVDVRKALEDADIRFDDTTRPGDDEVTYYIIYVPLGASSPAALERWEYVITGSSRMFATRTTLIIYFDSDFKVKSIE